MLIILNNKCNFTLNQFKQYSQELTTIKTQHELVLCPTNIYLSITPKSEIVLGAQDISMYHEGSKTGEVAAKQLKSMNVEYVIVGHSERRLYLNENDKQITEKLRRSLEQDIIPILCVGETIGDYQQVVSKQLEILKNIEHFENVIIAYEPVWAIGSGKTPTIKQINEVISFIKKIYPQNKVIYGGSINEFNISNLKSNLIDGYLLGGLSLNSERLKAFLENLE